jgi:hypothetical protein
LIKNITSLLLLKEGKNLSAIIGDFSNFLRIRIRLNIACGLYTLLSLASQLMYYYNYKNGINHTFLKVFEMMSSLVSPKSIGLTNEGEVYSLIRISIKLFLSIKLNNEIIISIFTLLLCFIPFIMNFSLMDSIIQCFYYLIVIQILTGIAQSTGFQTVMAIVGKWFDSTKKGLIFGI